MLLDMKNRKHRRILLLLLISAVAYALSSVIAYIAAVNLPASIALISTRVGFFIAVVAFLMIRRERIDLGFSRSGLVSWVYGISFAFVGLLLFLAYQTQSLSNIFPVIEGGVLVFLFLDLVFHHKKLRLREIILLLTGVLIVFCGTFFAESSGFHFQLSNLPYAIGIILFSGVAYYALENNTKKVTEGSKQIAFVIAGLVLYTAVLALYHGPAVLARYSNWFFLVGAVAGALLCLAFSMEMRAVKAAMTGDEKKDVVFRNFINNFTELDTVIVLLASIAIGSFTYDGLLGGGLIVLGVVILSLIR
jgi:drug/metabolite transporter (DMT)-like permease